MPQRHSKDALPPPPPRGVLGSPPPDRPFPRSFLDGSGIEDGPSAQFAEVRRCPPGWVGGVGGGMGVDVSTGDAQRRGVTQPCALCSPLAQLWDHLDHTMFFPDFRPFLSSGSLDQDGRDNERGHQAHAELWGPSRPPRLPMARRYRSRGSSRPDRSPAIEGYVSPTPGGGSRPWGGAVGPPCPSRVAVARWEGRAGRWGAASPRSSASCGWTDRQMDGWMEV